MGNENKVNRNLTEIKSRFLPADIDDPNAKGEVYALDKEFAAAAKNRSWTFYLIIFGFLAAIVAATFIITETPVSGSEASTCPQGHCLRCVLVHGEAHHPQSSPKKYRLAFWSS